MESRDVESSDVSVWSRVKNAIDVDSLELYGLCGLAVVFSVISFFHEPAVGVAFAIGAVYCAEIVRERRRRDTLGTDVRNLTTTVQALVDLIENPEFGDELARRKALERAHGVVRRPVS